MALRVKNVLPMR